jgi:hypothetical protein
MRGRQFVSAQSTCDGGRSTMTRGRSDGDVLAMIARRWGRARGYEGLLRIKAFT